MKRQPQRGKGHVKQSNIQNLSSNIQEHAGAGEMARQLGMLAALTEDLGLVPKPTLGSSQPLVSLVPGDLASSPSLHGRHTHKHIHINDINL